MESDDKSNDNVPGEASNPKRKSTSSIVSSEDEDEDSLADFKTPPLKSRPPPVTLKLHNDKNTRKKCNNLKVGSKAKLKLGNAKKDATQPKIESSFFKQPTSHVCPICFKTFSEETTCSTHVKSCASKNKISTKQLLDAIELQEKQAEERKALGLLAAPVLQPKKKPVQRKNLTKGDTELELALAISKSLQEEQEIQELQEAAFLAGESSQNIDNLVRSERRKTLTNFGFTSNKDATEAQLLPRARRKKLHAQTVLQTRSQEDRDKLLIGKISEILNGNESSSSQSQESTHQEHKEESEIFVKSRVLRQFHKTDDRLWDKTKFTHTGTSFYVDRIKPQLMESEESNDGSNEKEAQVRLDTSQDKDTSRNSYTSEPAILQGIEKLDITNDEDHATEMVNRWRETLNSSSMSDLLVFTSDGRHIWCHKLVIYVRCSDLLMSVEINEDERFSHVKEIVRWTDVDYSAALAFLEFLYCGGIEKYIVALEDKALKAQVRSLAGKYRVKSMFSYLRKIEIDSRIDKSVCEAHEKSKDVVASALDETDKELAEIEKLKNPVVDLLSKIEMANERSRFSNASPDLFDETRERFSCNEPNTSHINDYCPESTEDENLSALLSLAARNAELTQLSQTQQRLSKSLELAETSDKENTEDSKAHEEKSKGDMTLFIEKVQRENARSLSGADSTSDSPFPVYVKPPQKNPFFVKNNCFNDDSMEVVAEKKRNALSILESDIHKEFNENPKAFNVNSNEDSKSESLLFSSQSDGDNCAPKRGSLSDESEADDFDPISASQEEKPAKPGESISLLSDEEDEISESSTTTNKLSLSKVTVRKNDKRQEKVDEEDSIDLTQSNFSEEKGKMEEDELSQRISSDEEDCPVKAPVGNSTKTGSLEISEQSEVSVDSERDNMSAYSRYKKANTNNSIDKYREALKKSVSVKMKASGVSSNSSNNRPIEEENLADCFLDDDDVFEECSQKRTNPSELLLPVEDIENCFSDKDEVESFFYNENKNDLPLSQSSTSTPVSAAAGRKTTTSYLDEKMETRELEDLFNKSCDSTSFKVDDKNSVIELSDSEEDNVFTQADNNDKLSREVADLLNQCKQTSLSYSQIAQSSQEEMEPEKSKDSDNLSSSPVFIQSSPELHGDELNKSSGANKIGESPKSNWGEMMRTISEPWQGHSSKRKHEDTLSGDEDLEETRCRSNKRGHVEKPQERRKRRSASPETSKSNVRKFKVKSKSENCLPKNSSGKAGQTINFSQLDEAKLLQELQKFGLKPQKRPRAEKLLTHIYSQLSSVNEELPEASSTSANKNFGEEQTSSDEEIVMSQLDLEKQSRPQEEMEIEEENDKESSVDIASAFRGLIKDNQEIDNMMLKYEPLKLELIHSMLKDRGFKCKVTNLMDFLDEQCITFQCQQSKGNERRKKTFRKK